MEEILKSVVIFLFLGSLPSFTLCHRFNEMCLNQHYNIDFFSDSLDTYSRLALNSWPSFLSLENYFTF